MDLTTLNDAKIATRYRRRFWLGALIVLLLAGPAAIHSHDAIIGLFNHPVDWIPASEPGRVDFDEFANRFSVTDMVQVSWDGAAIGSPSLDQATALLAPLCEQSDSMVAPTDDSTEPLEKPGDDAAKELIRLLRDSLDNLPLHWARSGTEILNKMTSSPTSLPRGASIKRLTGSIIGSDGATSCLVLSISPTGIANRAKLFSTIRQALGLQMKIAPDAIMIVGGQHDGVVIDDASIRSIRTFSPPSAVVAALICFFCLRSISLTAVITLVAVIGEGFVLAAVYYSGTPMNAVLIVLPPLIFVLTVSSGIHLSNYYLDALAEFPEATRAQAVAIAMRAGTVPCLLAASTTIIGLGSLSIVRLEPIRVFGVVSVLGLITTLVLLLLLLPGAMMLFGGPRHVSDRELRGDNADGSPPGHWFRRRIRLLFRRVLDYPLPIIAVISLVAIVLSTGLVKLNTSVNVPRMFDPAHSMRVQYQWFEDHVGPTINGELLVRFPASNGTSDVIDRLEIVRQAHISTARAEGVGGVLSAVSFLPAVPNGRSLSSTATRSVIRGQLLDLDSAVGKLGYLSRDDQAEVWRVSFRLPMTTKSDYGPEITAVGEAVGGAVESAAAAKGISALDQPKVVMTGAVKIVQEAQEVLLRDLFRSFLSAFAVVAIVMMLLLRSVVGGLIAMIPNLLPTIGLFGYMGLVDMPLDIGSVMTASVALGIAVDDTIHLLSRFGSRVAKGIRPKRAAWGAMQQCGMAMVHTTLVCGLSLLVYAISDFVPTRRFAYLMFSLLAVALVGDLFLLPALMVSRFGRFLARPVMSDPDAELSNEEPDDQPMDVRRLPASGPRGRSSEVKVRL